MDKTSFKIRIKLLSGRVHEMDVQPDTKIIDVLNFCLDEMCFGPEYQFFLTSEGIKLEEDKTLKSYNLNESTVIVCSVKPIPE